MKSIIFVLLLTIGFAGFLYAKSVTTSDDVNFIATDDDGDIANFTINQINRLVSVQNTKVQRQSQDLISEKDNLTALQVWQTLAINADTQYKNTH